MSRRLALLGLVLLGLVLSVPTLAHAQGPGLYIAKAGTGRPACTSITSPAPGLTWCHDGNDLVLKVWNGSSYVGGGTAGVGSLNGLVGALAIQGTPNQVLVSALGATIGLSLPQSIATSSSPSFAGLTLIGIAPASTECLQISSLGVIGTSGATCGGGGGAGVSAINSATGGLTLVGVANRTTVTTVGTVLTVTLPNTISGLTSLSATTLSATTILGTNITATGLISGPMLVLDKGGQMFNVAAYSANVASASANDAAFVLARDAASARQGGIVWIPFEMPFGELCQNKNNVVVMGPGGARGITYIPSAPGLAAITFATGATCDGSAGDLFGSGLVGVGIYTANTTAAKTAVKLLHVSQFDYRGVSIGGGGTPWTSTAKTAIGLQTMGHDLSVLGGNSGGFNAIVADRPVVGSLDPWTTLDSDFFHFTDLYLIADSNPCIEFDTGVNLSSLVIENISCNKGTAGIRQVDTTSVSTSVSIVIRNVRFEQGQDPAAFAIDFRRNILLVPAIVTMRMENVFSADRNGIRLVNVSNVTLADYHYDLSGGVAYDFGTGTNGPIVVTNEFVNPTASRVTTGLVATTLTSGVKVYSTQAQAAVTFAGNVNFPGPGIWNSSGNVGVGTATPTGGRLSVVGPLGGTAIASTDGVNSSLAINHVGSPAATVQIFGTAGSNLALGANNAAVISISTGGVTKISPNTAALPGLPAGGVLQISNVAANPAYALIDTFGNQSALLFRRANGTPGARTPLVAGDLIGGLVALGAYDATNYSDPSAGGSAGIGFYADTTLPSTAAWSAGSRPTYMTFGTTPSGFTTIIERMRIAADGSISAVRSGVASTPLYGLTATLTGSRSGLGSVLIPAMYGPSPPGPLAWTLAPGGAIVVSDTSTWTPPCSAVNTPPGCDAINNQGVSSSALIVKHTFGPGFTSFGIASAVYAETQRNTLAVGLTDNDTYGGLDFILDNNTVTTNTVARYSQLTVNGTQAGLKAAGVFILSNHGNRQPDRHGISIGSGDIADTTTSYTAEAALNIGALAPNGAGAFTVEAWEKAIKYADRFAVLGAGAVVVNVPAGFVGHTLELGINGVSKFRVSESGDVGGLTLTIDGFAGLGANRTVCSNNGLLYTVASGAAC